MRFTRSKYEEIHKNGGAYDTFLTECYHKLEQLEDVEEEIGIDIFTLFKALEDGVFYKMNDKIEYTNELRLEDLKALIHTIEGWEDEVYNYFWFSDYGKTWALTKEELG